MLCTSGSFRAAPGLSACASSTDGGSEAELADGLLFASISSGATLARQNFRKRQAITELFRHVVPQLRSAIDLYPFYYLRHEKRN